MAAVTAAHPKLELVPVAAQAGGHGRGERPTFLLHTDMTEHAVAMRDTAVTLVGEPKVFAVRSRLHPRRGLRVAPEAITPVVRLPVTGEAAALVGQVQGVRP